MSLDLDTFQMRKQTALLVLFLWMITGINAQVTQDTLTIGYTRAAPFIISEEDQDMKGLSVWLWKKIAEDLQIP